jgi:hypothetical protein
MANLGKSVKGKNKKKKEEGKVEKVIAGKARRMFEVDLNKRLAAQTRRLLRVRRGVSSVTTADNKGNVL